MFYWEGVLVFVLLLNNKYIITNIIMSCQMLRSESVQPAIILSSTSCNLVDMFWQCTFCALHTQALWSSSLLVVACCRAYPGWLCSPIPLVTCTVQLHNKGTTFRSLNHTLNGYVLTSLPLRCNLYICWVIFVPWNLENSSFMWFVDLSCTVCTPVSVT